MPQIHRAATHAMGTRFEVVLVGDDVSRLGPIAECVVEAIEERHRRWSAFQRDSWLSFLNRTATERPVSLDEESFRLFELCADVFRRSDEAFDIGVGGLMKAHGFRGDVVAEARGGAWALDPEARTLRLGAGTSLDLGGIAKGDALDHAVMLLADEGIENALIHGGTSTVVALGAPPDRTGWRVRLGDLQSPCTVSLRDSVLSISKPRGRMVAEQGHIMDPDRGVSATGVKLAAVVGVVDVGAAARADAWSTALVVLGRRPETMPDSLTTLIVPDVDASPAAAHGPHAHCFRSEAIRTPQLIEESR